MPKGHVGWLEVDRLGLRKLLARRSKAFVILELIQNAWDEPCTEVNVSLSHPTNGLAKLVVTDDSPHGFHDLTHAFTLFAESRKKSNVHQRGAFNAGDKFVLAFCEEATILSTSGGVIFGRRGRRRTRKRTEAGSVFEAILKLTGGEWEEIAAAVQRIIPPVKTLFNDLEIPPRKSIREFECVLPTVIADPEGTLRRTNRKTVVRVYERAVGEDATLYEMGLPVVPTGDKWHVDVQQKVPLNLERDNVTPAYLQTLRVAVLNELVSDLDTSDASTVWVRQAAGDARVTANAFTEVINRRFGDRHLTFDPSDLEANRIAVSQDYVVISPASLSSEEWENVRRFEASLPAGRITPSPKPFSPSGSPVQLLAPEKKTAELVQFEQFARMIARELIGAIINVVFADDSGWGFYGCFGKGTLTVNVRAMAPDWFRGSPAKLLENWVPFLVHEFAHDKVPGHLTENYHRECCRLAGLLARRMFEAPQLFILADTAETSAHQGEDE